MTRRQVFVFGRRPVGQRRVQTLFVLNALDKLLDALVRFGEVGKGGARLDGDRNSVARD